jgi:hypothetical protein
MFVSGISLMKDEGARAFRVYVEAANGKNYRFPVQEVREYPSHDLPFWVFHVKH